MLDDAHIYIYIYIIYIYWTPVATHLLVPTRHLRSMWLNEGVLCDLPQHVQNDSPSSKSLAGLVVQLLQFQEDAFGRRVNNPALTKLPVS